MNEGSQKANNLIAIFWRIIFPKHPAKVFYLM